MCNYLLYNIMTDTEWQLLDNLIIFKPMSTVSRRDSLRINEKSKLRGLDI